MDGYRRADALFHRKNYARGGESKDDALARSRQVPTKSTSCHAVLPLGLVAIRPEIEEPHTGCPLESIVREGDRLNEIVGQGRIADDGDFAFLHQIFDDFARQDFDCFE